MQHFILLPRLPVGAGARSYSTESYLALHTDHVYRELAVYGPDLFHITFFDIGDEFPISPALAEVSDQWQLIRLEFLVFGGMGIVKSTLAERDISADEQDQPAVLLVEVLNKL